ncbi:APP1 Phosphatidate phosphatase APP1 [Candida maltosa Xu316]|uniref:Actin patch protein, putative (Actin filament organizing protein, putative) n=1 Tax=Candida maltosa (strain Xu316) TaxID=1245528 RepID=M3III0_CANMX|nr:Actin patch protein, putative (Actin filament organizing protein, putative) [Candida maltosa Xu316]
MSESSQPLSRRQRLLGLARNTRDTYIPKITGSVSSLATGASRALTNSDYYDEYGRVLLPKDTNVQLFPSYTRYQDGKYFVDVQGWVFTPGVMNRKNRIVFSVIKQIMKQRDASPATLSTLENDNTMRQEVFNPNSASSDNESIVSVESASSSQGSNSSINQDDVIKDRLSSFFAKSIPNTELTITIGSEADVDELVQQTIRSDGYGHFETTVEVPYKPSVIQAASSIMDTVFAFQDIIIYPNSGVGVISDIDDTIKLTGVIGDKMVLLRNLLTNEVSSWSIPEVTTWYGDIYRNNNVNFFYVSNSPWQLYNSITKYFQYADLPPGSVHLKRYNGNIISSLLEPSSSRKRKTLYKILEDFPNKKFVCVGDSGEFDLEAYVDIARTFKNQILSINIRYVEDSFSDLDDSKIYNELIRLLTAKRKKIPVVKINDSSVSNNMEDLIDLSDDPVTPTTTTKRKPPPPVVPNKPKNLQGNQLKRKPPPPPSPRTMPHKSYTDTALQAPHAVQKIPSSSNIASDGGSINEELPPLPPRRRTSPNGFQSDSGEGDLDYIMDSPGFLDLEEMDKKGATWIKRIIAAIYALEGTNTKIVLFKDEDDDFFTNHCIQLDELVKK